MPESEEERQFRETTDLKDPVLAGFLAWLIPGLGHWYQGRRGKAGLFFVCILGMFLYGSYLGSGGEFVLFDVEAPSEVRADLEQGVVSDDLRRDFDSQRVFLPEDASIVVEEEGRRWRIVAGSVEYTIVAEDEALNVLGRLGHARVVYASWREGDKRLPYLCQVGAGLSALPALVQAIRVRDDKQPWWNGFMAPAPISAQEDSQPFDQFGRPTGNTIQKHLAHYFELGTVYTMIAGLLNILAVYDACCGPVFSPPPSKEDEEDEDEEDQEEDAAVDTAS